MPDASGLEKGCVKAPTLDNAITLSDVSNDATAFGVRGSDEFLVPLVMLKPHTVWPSTARRNVKKKKHLIHYEAKLVQPSICNCQSFPLSVVVFQPSRTVSYSGQDVSLCRGVMGHRQRGRPGSYGAHPCQPANPGAEFTQVQLPEVTAAESRHPQHSYSPGSWTSSLGSFSADSVLLGVSSSVLDRSEIQLMLRMAVDTLSGWWGISLESPSTYRAIDVSRLVPRLNLLGNPCNASGYAVR